MKLIISQLHEGENSIQFNSQRDSWVADVVKRVAEKGYAIEKDLEVEIRLTKLEPDYYMRGTLVFGVQQSCSRCTESFFLPIRQTFEIAFAHVANLRSRRIEMTEESEELDVNFFDGNEIDLSPVLEEQFFLSLPYQALCKKDCNGICQQCGKNMNGERCGCEKSSSPHPFSVLQAIKVL